MNLTQCEIILKAMIENKDKKEWTAKDFQSGKYFVGYEATARMSDLLRMYPGLVIAGKDGRFRTLKLNWECVDEINQFKKEFEIGEKYE
ncbi:hypothetical protein IKS57_02820 [bacterium]|nr:hypothetical protein [bacterium]